MQFFIRDGDRKVRSRNTFRGELLEEKIYNIFVRPFIVNCFKVNLMYSPKLKNNLKFLIMSLSAINLTQIKGLQILSFVLRSQG